MFRKRLAAVCILAGVFAGAVTASHAVAQEVIDLDEEAPPKPGKPAGKPKGAPKKKAPAKAEEEAAAPAKGAKPPAEAIDLDEGDAPAEQAPVVAGKMT